MATFLPRPEPDAGMVPPELRDKEHEVWADPDRYVRWCRRHGLAPDPRASDWALRFQAGRDSWGIAAGVEKGGNADAVRLAALGIPYSYSRDRMRASLNWTIS